MLAINAATKRMPILLMTTNGWRVNKHWQLTDLEAFAKRFAVILRFSKPLPDSVKKKCPASFRMDLQCPACSQALQRFCIAEYEKDPSKAKDATAHNEPGASLKALHPDLICDPADAKSAYDEMGSATQFAFE